MEDSYVYYPNLLGSRQRRFRKHCYHNEYKCHTDRQSLHTIAVLGNIVGGVTTIPAQSFTNDSGTSVAANGLIVSTSSGYYNVFVNGTFLRGVLTTLSTANLIINTGLVVGVTVVIEVIFQH